MRLTYVTRVPAGLGGAEGLLLALLAEGRSRGCEQTVLNLVATGSQSELALKCPSSEYQEVPLDGLGSTGTAYRWLGEQLVQTNPQIIHASLFLPLIVVAATRRRSHAVRLVTHVYGDGVTELSHPALRKRLDRWACRRFDYIVAISDSVARFLIEEHGCRPDRVQRIQPGWSGQPLPRAAGNRPPTIVSVARLRPEKGHETLLAAFTKVLTHEPRARLVLVGGGPMREQLENSARARNIASRVEFAGSVPDIWPYLAEADVFALASKSEAFGIAIVEAMAAGLPVVAPAVGGIPELVTPGLNGDLFSAGDVDGLASSLIDVLSSDRRAEMASAARAIADNCKMERTVAKYFELYDQIAPPLEKGVGL